MIDRANTPMSWERDSNSVLPIHLSNRSLHPRIPVGKAPLGIVISPTGKQLLFANSEDNTVTPIGYLAKHHPLPTIPVGKKPVSLTISPDDKTLYVVNEGADTVTLINLSSK